MVPKLIAGKQITLGHGKSIFIILNSITWHVIKVTHFIGKFRGRNLVERDEERNERKKLIN